MAKKLMIQSAKLISFVRPVAICKTVQLRNPQIIPWVIEYVNGISTIARNAGKASCSKCQLILTTGFIMKTPTRTSAGAVAIAGTALINGDKNRKGRNNTAPTIAVSPVLPPCSIPTADSI